MVQKENRFGIFAVGKVVASLYLWAGDVHHLNIGINEWRSLKLVGMVTNTVWLSLRRCRHILMVHEKVEYFRLYGQKRVIVVDTIRTNWATAN
jgi:hypothetical protein